MSAEKVIEQFACDINITRARYAELLIAECDGNRLKEIIHQKATKYSGLSYDEIKVLDLLFSPMEDEPTEGVTDDDVD